MKQVISIISRKGGVGKTTTTQALGGALQKSGASVLLLDLDAQMNLSASMGAKLTGLNVARLLEETATAAEVIKHTDNGDIITGSPLLAGADNAMTSDKDLTRAIRPILKSYDYILIDTPRDYGRLTRNALAASTSAIITANASDYSIQGLPELVRIIEQMKNINPALKLRGVIVTNYGGRSNDAKQALADLRQAAAELGTGVIDPPIRRTDKVESAQQRKLNLTDYAPRSTAAQDYLAIADIISSW